ncbi:MAG: serine protein kinase RIO [Candidatus Woesearchaeota archaeon]
MVRNSREAFKTYGNVFDNFTINNLRKLSSQGHFEELNTTLKPGKEANVFTATKSSGEDVVVKIYRLENCNFNKMFDYISQDPRYSTLKGQKRKIIFAWTQREYRNLMKAREIIRVPSVYAFKDNIIVMEFINDGDLAAPLLKDVELKNPKKVFNEIIKNMKKLFEIGLVHGDLSEFNILMQNNRPVFIDFSQSCSIEAGNAKHMLERDIKNICLFFRRFKVDMPSEDEILLKMTKKSK